jgi:hypothetical protein
MLGFAFIHLPLGSVVCDLPRSIQSVPPVPFHAQSEIICAAASAERQEVALGSLKSMTSQLSSEKIYLNLLLLDTKK